MIEHTSNGDEELVETPAAAAAAGLSCHRNIKHIHSASAKSCSSPDVPIRGCPFTERWTDSCWDDEHNCNLAVMLPFLTRAGPRAALPGQADAWLRRLVLSGMQLGDNGLQALSESAVGMGVLRRVFVLNLSENHVGDAGMGALAVALSSICRVSLSYQSNLVLLIQRVCPTAPNHRIRALLRIMTRTGWDLSRG